MARSSRTFSLSRLPPIAALVWLSLTAGASAQTSATVIWLPGTEGGDREARARALRLELEARNIVLLSVEPALPAPQNADGPPSREVLARETLRRTRVDAVLWLEGDPSRPVSWLRVAVQGREGVKAAPLPHPPDAIETELFAIAAASLLEQALREPVSAERTEPERKTEPAPTPVQAALAAPAPRREAASRPAHAAHERDDRRWFVQGGIALTFADVHSGMEAATRPSLDEVFFVSSNDRMFFDDSSSWVPDHDSFDDYENADAGIPRGSVPVPGDCEADGIVTGPVGVVGPSGEPFTKLEPSRYCVRVEEPGFALEPALRLVFGRWLLPKVALGLLYQGHFGIDADTFFGSQLFGLHLEYHALGTRGRAVTLSLLAELTIGRTETTVPPRGDRKVNALGGPLGAQGGALVRWWPVSSFALLLSTTLGARFPATQFVFEPSAGLEVPF